MSLSASYSSLNRKKPNFLQRLRLLISNLTIEPIILCYMLPFSLSGLTHQNLNLEKACRVNFNYSASICTALSARNLSGFSEKDEVTVQQLVAKAYIWKSLIFSIWPALLLIFLGSWSDRNKCRKVVILLPLVGQALSNIGLLVSTYFFNEIWMELNVLIDILPSSLAGGSCVLLVGTFSYVSENTEESRKTWRIGIIHIILNVSTTTGIALSGFMYRWIGFYGVFSISAVVYLFGFVYGCYHLKETNCDKEHTENFFKDFFNIKKILQTYRFIGRKGHSRKIKLLVLITIVGILNMGPMVGENAVLYLYTRYKFHWDEVDFSMFFTYHSVAHLIGSSLALYIFSKHLNINDALLGVLAVISKILGGIVYTLAHSDVVFYLGTLAEVISGVTFIAARSIISKTIPSEELGRANSIFGIAESLTILIYGPMYSALYKATLGVFSGSFFVLGALFSVPTVIMYIGIYFYQKKNRINEKIGITEDNKKRFLKPNHQPE